MSFRIVETNATQSQHSKALAVFPRTLEIFDMAGIVGPFLRAANRVTKLGIITHERRLGRIEFRPAGTPYEFIAMVPQDVTEQLLHERLHSRGGEVEYQTQFLSLQQNDSGVEAAIERAGEKSSIVASYVVGCDGAHSAVRHALGFEFEGAEYAETYLLADAMTDAAFPADEMALCPSTLGPCAIFPISATRWRIVATADTVEGDAPSLDSVNLLLAKRGPRGLRAKSLVWSTYFRIHHRCVTRMSQARVFLAGDAAHIHSPFGGQGMNTGLQDAWNLAWKLDLAIRGRATDALLASYTLERHPIVLGVIAITNFLTNALGARNPIVAEFRNAAIPVVTHFPKIQEAFAERLSGLGIAYKGSPIVEGNGKRYFDASLAGDAGIAGRFILMLPSGEHDDAAANGFAARFDGVVERRASADGAVRLVRPDGYLAYEATGNVDFSKVEEVLLRQITLRG